MRNLYELAFAVLVALAALFIPAPATVVLLAMIYLKLDVLARR